MKKPNYYKEAFTEVLNLLIILSVAITAILGFKAFALIGLVVEIIYMIKVPTMIQYQRAVNLRNNYQEELANTGLKESRRQLFNLHESVREKCLKLENKYNEIIRSAAKKPDVIMMMSKELEQLEYLLENYISFSETLANYTTYLNENSVENLNSEINDIKHRINHCFEGLKDNNDLDLIHKRMEKKTLLKNNLSVMQKRIEKIKEVRGLSETLKAELDVIENTFYLIGDYIVTFSPGEHLNVDLNSIVHNVENTGKIVKDTQKEMSKLKSLEIKNMI